MEQVTIETTLQYHERKLCLRLQHEYKKMVRLFILVLLAFGLGVLSIVSDYIHKHYVDVPFVIVFVLMFGICIMLMHFCFYCAKGKGFTPLFMWLIKMLRGNTDLENKGCISYHFREDGYLMSAEGSNRKQKISYKKIRKLYCTDLYISDDLQIYIEREQVTDEQFYHVQQILMSKVASGQVCRE